MKMTRVVSAVTGINGLSLAHHISKTSTEPYLFFIVIFETDIERKHLRKV